MWTVGPRAGHHVAMTILATPSAVPCPWGSPLNFSPMCLPRGVFLSATPSHHSIIMPIPSKLFPVAGVVYIPTPTWNNEDVYMYTHAHTHTPTYIYMDWTEWTFERFSWFPSEITSKGAEVKIKLQKLQCFAFWRWRKKLRTTSKVEDCCYGSVGQSCLTLQPQGLQYARPPVNHQLQELAQAQVHWVSDCRWKIVDV